MMRRIIFKVFVFLLLGAIINVAVAWSIAIGAASDKATFHGVMSKSRADATKDDMYWLRRMGHLPKEETQRTYYVIEVAERIEFGLTQRSFFEFRRLKPGMDGRVSNLILAFAVRSKAGWPFRSLGDDLWEETQDDGSLGKWQHRSGFIIHEGENRHAVPLKPLWPGFAINTIFYAAVLWMIFVMPFALRRRRRIERGLCARCAYPIGTSPICTECGAAAPLSRKSKVES